MADKHLENSIKYCKRLDKSDDLKLLEGEKRRRSNRTSMVKEAFIPNDERIESNLAAKKLILDAASKGNKLCGMYAALAWSDSSYGVDDWIDYDPSYDAWGESGGIY